MVGKTRRFTIDRLVAIVQFLTTLELEGSDESKLLNQSTDFYACINTLVDEGILKKASMRTGIASNTHSATDDFCNIGYKCNFDANFIN